MGQTKHKHAQAKDSDVQMAKHAKHAQANRQRQTQQLLTDNKSRQGALLALSLCQEGEAPLGEGPWMLPPSPTNKLRIG